MLRRILIARPTSLIFCPQAMVFAVFAAWLVCSTAYAQEARRRWEMQRQIRLDKFEQILPLAMRNAGIDMWIVAVKENHREPLWEDLGRGYVTTAPGSANPLPHQCLADVKATCC
jgi:hypothetical protein